MNLINKLKTLRGEAIKAIAVGSLVFSVGCGGPVQAVREYVRDITPALNQQSDELGGRPTSSGLVDSNYTGEVVELNDSNFYDFVEKGNRVVLFWNDTGPNGYGCGYRQAVNEFNEVAREVKYVNFGRVDVGRNQELKNALDVRLVDGIRPDIIYFKDSKVLEKGLGRGGATDIFRMGEIVPLKCRELYLNNKGR